MILIEKHGKILICLLEIKEYYAIKTICSKGRISLKEILSLLCVPRKGMKLKMEEIKKFLKEKGYEDNDINKILSHSALPKQNSEKLLTNIKEIYELFSSLGYTQQEIIKMTKDFPTLFSLKTENVAQKIEGMVKLGYKREDVINMTKVSSSIFGYNLNNIKQK